MNIKILDSWLKEYVQTSATPQQIAEKLSLASVSVERLDRHGNDYIYDIEVTTNRPDLMSIVGLARETVTVLNQNNISAHFVPPKLEQPKRKTENIALHIVNNPKLVNRICAVVMEVTVKDSPHYIKERLETTDIRSLNNLIDITNYVMRVIGHPTHVFDYDRLGSTIKIRESQSGEKIATLDKKDYTLPGGDIVAENNKGKIVDLLGIMGLENSVVTNDTKRILFFIDNVKPYPIRKTSMTLGIRTEAAQINEKTLDPELAMDALLYGIKLYEEFANGRMVSKIVDDYPNKREHPTIIVSEEKINTLIGVNIPLHTSAKILSDLGFQTKIITPSPLREEGPRQSRGGEGEKPDETNALQVTPPSFRAADIQISEDVIEEIARIYGYHNLPNALPPMRTAAPTRIANNEFYWENRVKDMLKYWGFTEIYTYPMVSEALFEGPIQEAVTIQNPMSEDMTYLRRTLVPSLLKVVRENKNHDQVKIFEIANVYLKRQSDLPEEILTLAGLIKHPHVSFYETKGIIEQMLTDLGIKNVSFKPLENNGYGATVYISSLSDQRESKGDQTKSLRQVKDPEVKNRRTQAEKLIGTIEILDDNLLDFELDFEQIIAHATLKKRYKPISKYPPVVEDLAIIAPDNILTGELIEVMKTQNPLVIEVSLLDKYKDTRTFHIVYQSYEKNLTDKEVGEIREKILKTLKEKFGARLKD